jgi:type III restriction enzyme
MQLKNYQKIAVDKLSLICRKLLEKDGQRVCVFKAPTGSGKTIMIADFLDQIGKEHLPSKYAYLWISGNNLHKQSREKLENYLSASRYSFSYLEDIQNNELHENEIAFVNWHSLTKQDKKTGEYTNLFMRDNEGDKNLGTFINNAKEKRLQIILIVDESHYHYWSQKSQQLVQDVIGPKLTLEVSATPKLEPSSEDIVNGDAGFVSIRFEDVVEGEMIKTEVVINKEIGKHAKFEDVADEVILSASLENQEEIRKLFKKEKSDVHPLVLVQLPNEGEATSALDKTKLEFVEKYLKDKHKITVENGKLAIWLSERKENLENITANDNDVEVLIFKQAIAMGWDCPRAQILVMFRDIKSSTFEIQTVGRIMRMPEAHHYEDDELNRAFVYTNLPKVEIAKDKESQTFFAINPSHRKQEYKKVGLPSVYLSRVDYGDLTLSFRKLLIEEANKYFGIEPSDSVQVAKKKADVKLDLLPKELLQPVITDAVLENIDNVKEIVGNVLNFKVPEDDLKYKFEYFAKAMSLPFAPVRSHTKIQQALYDWFDSFIGYKDSSRLEIQRIVVCSPVNQKIFREIIESAKERFRDVNRKEKMAKQRKKEVVWDVPAVDYFNESYDKVATSKNIMEPCYLQRERSKPEKDFEEILESSKSVEWWYKNGVSKESYFAIQYQDPKSGIARAFYPDYIVRFSNKEIGVYDTKSGFTADSEETKAKSDALQKYIKSNDKVKGGIVVFKSSGAHVFADAKYSSDLSGSGWQKMQI